MNNIDLNNIKIPDDLSSVVNSSVIKAKMDERKRKARLKAAIAATVMVATILGSLYTFNPNVKAFVKGVFDNGLVSFWELERDNVSPIANQLSQSNIVQEGGETSEATFTVIQSMFDNRNIHVVVEVKAKNPDILFVDHPDSDMSNYSYYHGEEMTAKEYAKKYNKKIMYAFITTKQKYCDIGGTPNSEIKEEGTVILEYSSEYTGPNVKELVVNIECALSQNQEGYGYGSDDYEDVIEKAMIKYKAIAPKEIKTITNIEPVIFEEYGVRVDTVTLEQTPLAIYYKIDYTIVDKALFKKKTITKFANDDDYYYDFEFSPIDENGDIIRGFTGATLTYNGLDELHFTGGDEAGTLPYTENLPDEITLAGITRRDIKNAEIQTIKFK